MPLEVVHYPRKSGGTLSRKLTGTLWRILAGTLCWKFGKVYGKDWGQPYSTVLKDFKEKAGRATKTDP
jgi:hypothetical protein